MLKSIVRINNQDEDFTNVAIGDASKLFNVATNSKQRKLQLSYPKLQVWELFPNANIEKNYLENSKYDAIYYHAEYVDTIHISIDGLPVNGSLSKKSLSLIINEKNADVELVERFKNILNSDRPIRIIKLMSDCNETN